ncbi:TolC family protein [Gillisia marina]|uniref:TolC family protein n=1 Tax=Gillisia marina TaxID=1167637 RepID=UPI00029A42C2|nr:TolC family protein [Gillisia marina]
MRSFRKLVFIFLAVLTPSIIIAQELNQILTFEEYLGYVKEHHPLMKQADLTLSIGEANLLRARGGFDPKIEVDYDRKKFKNTEYYDLLNATFKIPTWYGIEFKANFEENSGQLLNPSLKVPDEGLYSAGVSFSLAQGLLTNERMASLKQAKFFLQQSQADRDYLVNDILFNASIAYFEWLEATNELQIYSTFLDNAEVRLKAITRSVEEGDKAAIDITEARILVQNRKLDLEMSQLKKRKAELKVSNYLWINNIPLELEENVIPDFPSNNVLERVLILEGITNTAELANRHPKIRSLNAKIDGLRIDRNLKRNRLLPKIDLQYNFLSQDYEQISSFNLENYKAFVNVSFPIFLRKERGDLQLASYKIENAEFDQATAELIIANKIAAINFEINSLKVQNQLIKEIVKDYELLVNGEERKFFLGESSLFLINSREQKLIDAQIKENLLLIKQLNATAKLFNALGASEISLN